MLTRGRDEIDEAFFTKRIERALRFRGVLPGAETLRLVYGEADSCRAWSWTAMATARGPDPHPRHRAAIELVRSALERVLHPRGAVRMADSPLRALEACRCRASGGGARCPTDRVGLEGFRVEADLLHGQKTAVSRSAPQPRVAEARARGPSRARSVLLPGEWRSMPRAAAP